MRHVHDLKQYKVIICMCIPEAGSVEHNKQYKVIICSHFCLLIVDFLSLFTINFMCMTSYFHVISRSAHGVGGN